MIILVSKYFILLKLIIIKSLYDLSLLLYNVESKIRTNDLIYKTETETDHEHGEKTYGFQEEGRSKGDGWGFGG